MQAADVEKVRELLNYTGYPFQHHCADRIAKLDGFQVSIEVPYTHPGSNGPLLGVHGSIDILAARPSTDGRTLVWFVVECKKANDKIKNWILFPNGQQDPRWPTFISSIATEGQNVLSFSRTTMFPRLGYKSGADYDYCISGIEANTDLKNANQDKGEKIYNPLKQVAHGQRAFELTYPKIVEGIEYWRGQSFERYIYVPVVLTTANIYSAEFEAGGVTHGEIPAGSLDLDGPKRWVTYEFALPDFLSYSLPRPGGSVRISKQTIFIVNDKSIDDFFAAAVDVVDPGTAPAR